MSGLPQFFNVEIVGDAAPPPHPVNLKAQASVSDGPTITPIGSRLYLDASTQKAWANNDMAAIVKEREQAGKDLSILYQNIEQGEKAWTKVKDAQSGKSYHLSWTDNTTMWCFVDKQPGGSNPTQTQNVVISIGIYSKNANTLGVSGYAWNNIPVAVPLDIISLVFVRWIGPLVREGIAWTYETAGKQLVGAAVGHGDELAKLIEDSIAPSKGLSVAGVLCTLFPEALLPTNLPIRRQLLVVNVYNFDPDHKWRSVMNHNDGGQVYNGEWKTDTVDPFAAANKDHFPPGFTPAEESVGVVNCLSWAFQPDRVVLGRLGTGVFMSREDNKAGAAFKYASYILKDSEIGLEGIDGDTSDFDLEKYYNADNWVKAQSVEVQSGSYKMTGYTPNLGRPDDGISSYFVNIGLPPPVTPK